MGQVSNRLPTGCSLALERGAGPRVSPVVWLKRAASAVTVIRLEVAVKASGTTLTEVFGVGPYVAATVTGYVIDVSRFADRDHFASYNGTAPIEVSSGGHKVFRFSRRGNRRLDHAIHMAAVTQVSHRHSEGRAYYDRKVKEGKTTKEALRCLKRRISDAIFAHLVADASARPRQLKRTREGKGGTALSPAWPAHTPSASSSDKPLPGPSPPYVARRPHAAGMSI